MDDDSLTSLVMTRRFAVAPERLFDAWTDPAVTAKWLFTGPTSEAHTCELDVRVGGRWEIADRRDGVDYRALGEYLEVDRPRRLVFTFGMPQFSPESATVTIEIAADGDGAVMTLTHMRLPWVAVKPTEEGWGAMFDRLAELLA